MIKILSYFTIFCIGFLNTYLIEATERMLTDIQGRTINVKLLDKDEDSVLVEMANGRVYDIAFKKLSTNDQSFLLDWEPSPPKIPKNPTDAVCTIESSGSGTGFFAHDKGRVFLYTNQHVIGDAQNIKVTDSQGNDVKLGLLQVSNSHDLARYLVNRKSALILEDKVSTNSNVAVLGNSLGAGVITFGEGLVKGVGSFELEIDGDFVSGNSGGPVLDSENNVIGVVTYMKPPDSKPNWTTKDTRYSMPRRFVLRPSRISDWVTVAPHDYAMQRQTLNAYQRKFDQVYWTYDLLTNGIGYVGTIPENWESEIKDIIYNHNNRQNRPDSTRTDYYLNGYYQGSKSKSHSSKKEASRRANLRALNDFIENEFDDYAFYQLNNNDLTIAYFRLNNYDGTKLLQQQVSILTKAIKDEIELSMKKY